jgi:hypothetical protein
MHDIIIKPSRMFCEISSTSHNKPTIFAQEANNLCMMKPGSNTHNLTPRMHKCILTLNTKGLTQVLWSWLLKAPPPTRIEFLVSSLKGWVHLGITVPTFISTVVVGEWPPSSWQRSGFTYTKDLTFPVFSAYWKVVVIPIPPNNELWIHRL